MKRNIRLRGASAGPFKGKVWQGETLLRSGRLGTLEIVIDDPSVSRRHGELRADPDGGWYVKDLGSTNGTYVNGTRVPPEQDFPIKPRDIVQFGKIALLVELLDVTIEGPPSDQLVLSASLSASSANHVALRPIFDKEKMPRAGDQLIALLRAGHHLAHLRSEDQLLDNILNDAVSVLDAQRGAIVLADGEAPDAPLRLRSLAVGPGEPASRFPFSKRLVQRAFAAGESQLYGNLKETEEFRMTKSIADGSMASVLCVLLRTPRAKLGVLHLDRGFFQAPFTEADLHLADALAAHLSTGIECSQLLRRQRDTYQRMFETLADVVELKDEYTRGHTRRVTRYAVMLAEALKVSDDELETVRIGTPLHDIGKIAIDESILRKPGKLTPQEFEVMQSHTTKGAEFLSGIPELRDAIPIVRNHHERWDGTGYPDRLRMEEIPLLARIVGVCDCFDAITSNRPYHVGQRGKPAEFAFAEIAKMSGRQFDPACAAAFLDIKDSVLSAMAELTPSDTPSPGSFRPAESGAPTAVGLGADNLFRNDSVAEIRGIG